MRKTKFPQLIGSFLEGYFLKRGWNHKLKEYRIWTHWDTLVGPKLAKRCQPLRLRHSTLTLGVSTSSWLQQLQYMKPDLLRKINETLRVRITDIKLIVRPIQRPIEPYSAKAHLTPADKLMKGPEAFQAPPMDSLDAELRETFHRIFDKHRSRTEE